MDAVLRRASAELGLPISAPELVLPDFRYRAVDASGVVEYEICPVYVAYTDATPEPNPDEVVEWAWAEPESLLASVEQAPFAFSPWLTLQLPLVVPLLAESTAR